MKEFIDKLISRLEENSFDMSLENPDCKAVWTDKAIEIVNELAESYHIHCEQEYMKGYEDARQCGGWIPCSERLPEVNTNVIAQFSSGVVSELLFNEKGLFQGIYEYGPNVIVAWQPLPEPYKPQESEWKDKVMKHFTKTE